MKKTKTCNGCGEDKPIWKNHEGQKYCQYCWNKIKFKKEGFKPKNQKPINPRSKKQQALDAAYSKLRKKYLEEHPMCEIAVSPNCAGKASEIHHTEYRGKNYLVVSTWCSTCRACHNWVHSNPKEARELGFLK